MRPALAVAGLLAASPLLAQSPIYPVAQGAISIDTRSVAFSDGIRLSDASQTAVRLIGGVPLGRRVFVDVVSAYAVTRLASNEGLVVDRSGPTDTQLRAAYTIGRGDAALSIKLDLPTGDAQVPSEQVPLLRAMAQNFLPFPVSAYSTGAGVTAGASIARRFGEWSLGAAGSLRYAAAYSPYADVDDRYSPGVEGRIRVGGRRSLGARTSLLVALTASSFGTDDFSGVQNFTYRPGDRYVGETVVTHQVGRTTLRTFGWVFWRSADDSSGVTVEKPKERVLYGGGIWSVPVTRRVVLDPGLDVRVWNSADGASGRMVAGGVAARVRLASGLTLAPSIRLERGDLDLVQGVGASFTGLAGTLLVWVRR